jgi:hypothetical protein
LLVLNLNELVAELLYHIIFTRVHEQSKARLGELLSIVLITVQGLVITNRFFALTTWTFWRMAAEYILRNEGFGDL